MKQTITSTLPYVVDMDQPHSHGNDVERPITRCAQVDHGLDEAMAIIWFCTDDDIEIGWTDGFAEQLPGARANDHEPATTRNERIKNSRHLHTQSVAHLQIGDGRCTRKPCRELISQ
jgi:hypothetical protein